MLESVNEETLKSLIGRCQQKIFALVYYLVGSDSDKAYEIAVLSFVEAFRTTPAIETENAFFIRLVHMAVEKSRDATVIPSFDESCFINTPLEKRQSFLVFRRALQALPFREKALLLMRDQLHLSYTNISSVLGTSHKNTRIQTVQARDHIRSKVEEALRDVL